MGILSPYLRNSVGSGSVAVNASIEWGNNGSDLPIVRANGGNDALTLADRNFRDELTRPRPYRSREGDDIIMASFPDKMIGDGMESKRFLPQEPDVNWTRPSSDSYGHSL